MAQSNTQWLEIFDAISDFIVVHDQAGRVLRVNRSIAEFIGVPASELIGLSMRSLMPLAQRLPSELCPFCAGEADSEYLHGVLDRTYLVSTSHINATLDEGTQTIHVLKDVTDRREAERRYRELFDNVQEGLFFATPEGRFVEVNDALVRMLGYESREALLSIDIQTQLFPSPERYLEFRGALQSAGLLRSREEAFRRKDGGLVHTLTNVLLVRDAAGKVIQYRGLMQDISELKSFQAELQRQRDFNAKILENTQSLILVVDTAGLVSYANPRAYQVGGFRPGQLVGCRLRDLIVPAQQEKYDQALLRTLLGLQVDNLELMLLLPSTDASRCRRPGRVSRRKGGLRRRSQLALLRQSQPHARRARPRELDRGGDERHHRCAVAAIQAHADREDGGRRATGFRGGARGQQPADGDSGLCRPADAGCRRARLRPLRPADHH